jgi:hypothetical protein
MSIINIQQGIQLSFSIIIRQGIYLSGNEQLNLKNGHQLSRTIARLTRFNYVFYAEVNKNKQ